MDGLVMAPTALVAGRWASHVVAHYALAVNPFKSLRLLRKSDQPGTGNELEAIQHQAVNTRQATELKLRQQMENDGLSVSGGNPSPADAAVTLDDGVDSDLTAWDDLARTQGDMYKQCVRKNAMLQAQVKKLQEELDVWKIGFNSKTKEKEDAEARAGKLDQTLTAIHEDNPLVICLIDGDGAVFSESFIHRGREGGRDAAAALNAALKSYVESYNATLSNNDTRNTQDVNGFSAGRIMSPQISLQEFFIGFNQASPLFTLVDVGEGKEAADAKLRESLKLHARLPQTRKVIFGGCHDNGYMPTLISLATEGHLDKLVILQGSSNMAYDIDKFRHQAAIHVITVPGLFLQKTLHSAASLSFKQIPNPFAMPVLGQPISSNNYNFPVYNASNGPSPKQNVTPAKPATPLPQQPPNPPPQKAPKSKRKGTSSDRNPPPTPTVSSPPANNGSRTFLGMPPTPTQAMPSPVHKLDPNKPFSRQVPPPCNVFYLGRAKCKSDAATCKYSHAYDLSPAQIQQFREELASTPCRSLMRKMICASGPQKCFYSHECPEPRPCAKLAAGNCKFLHNQPSGPVIRFPQSPASTSGLSLSESVWNHALLDTQIID
ncbi:hypothetical protein FRB97_001060 [Tulasnella sp. 331]|nr:hypothetical protein FRB97_001060 [Tulasnella sp. 331]